MSDLKLNKCSVKFLCTHSEKNPCVYFYGDNVCCKDRVIKFSCTDCASQWSYCTSSVALVNAMTLELKELKGD